MTEHDALHNGPGSAWYLLLQFVLPDEPGSEHQSVNRVTGAVQELRLQPAEVERIGKAVMETLRKAIQREKCSQHNSAVSIRVWVSGVSTEDLSRSSSDAERVGQQKGRGWGFFLLEKQESDPHVQKVGSHRMVELYLYQERASAKKGGGRERLDPSRQVLQA